jgi:capsular polysaccharide biosynthesis protein
LYGRGGQLPAPTEDEIMNLIFSPPSLDDLIRLFKAWRFWSLGALIGGLIGAAFYYVAPPPFRAHAVVLVDFNLEQAWPQETDRQQFYYLERETRKLEEIAHSDAVLEGIVQTTSDVTIEQLRSGMLILSQPAEGGWNFYVDDDDPERAASIATAWATQFTEQVSAQTSTEGGLNAFIGTSLTRIALAPLERSRSTSLYIFVGAVMFLMIGSIVILFFSRPDRFHRDTVHHETVEPETI